MSVLPKFASLSWRDFRLLVESVVDYAIYLLDPEGRVATWNAGAERINGYRASDIVGEHVSTFYPSEDLATQKPEQVLRRARAFGQVSEQGWRVRQDGSRFWASDVITALRDAKGSLLGFASVTRNLTNSLQAEDELRRSEERFRLLVENIGDYAIYMLDTQGRVTTWNLGAQRMKGYAAAEVIGQKFSMFFPEADVAAGKPEWELSVALERGRFEDEGWRVRKDGTRFWANAVLTALHDPQGRLIGYAKITRDLTERRERDDTERRLYREQIARETAEAGECRLRESEQRYRALSRRLEIILEGVADGITVQDRSGRVVFANSAAAELCGLGSAKELVETPPERVLSRFEVSDENGNPVAPEDLPGRRVLNGELSSARVLLIRECATRREWWSHVRATGVLGDDGTPELAVNIWHEVTSERRQERQAKYLADATTALGSSLDYDEMLSTLARVLVPELGDWCTIHLLEQDQLRHVAAAHVDPEKLELGEAYLRRFSPDPKQTRGVWNVVRTGISEMYNDVTDETLSDITKDPERLAFQRRVGIKAALIVPIQIRSRILGTISLVSTESNRRYDQADLQLAEELGRRAGVALENAQLYMAAQHAAKAAEEASRAKDEFLAIVSHELRTPLSAIVGWASLLNERVKDSAIAKPIEVIYRNAQAQIRIIDDILDVSRVITGKFRLDIKPTDVVTITRDAIEVVRPSASAKQISIEFNPDREYCLLAADPDRLQQVVWNLLSNAVKFTDSRGNIWVSLQQQGSNVVLSVRDSGRGIDAAFLPYVFDRFRQADASITRRVGGLGLGLALVRHIVELHGGRVLAMSDGLGRGATFTITLPIVAVLPDVLRAPRTQAETTVTARGGVDLSQRRVLVVDDEPDARELILTVLTHAGATVRVAGSANDAWMLFHEFKPDVVVSDIGMPDEDGFTFMRRLRELPTEQGGSTPALALTALAREEDRTRAIAAGYNAHLGKPVKPDELTRAVAGVMVQTKRAR